MSTKEERFLEMAADAGQDMPDEIRRNLSALANILKWEREGRAEQQAPNGKWRSWYIQAGRGAGKSRAGAQWLSEQEYLHPPGSWAIVAPTFADGRDTCVEETLLKRVPGFPSRVESWNRSLGEMFLKSGSRIYVDGADDGALRIQGKNLCGAWCDEVGLWKDWDRAWNETLAFAVRVEPARIVATGTPKMGHPLVKLLVEDEKVVVTRMRTADNFENLPESVIEDFYERYGGTRLGNQELDGEWLAALEGDLLKRADWRYYEPRTRKESFEQFRSRLPKFNYVVVSVDTPLKDKESSDNVAIQVWGMDKANSYLLEARTDKMSYDQARRSVIELSRWARHSWRGSTHRTLIENAGYGAELLVELKREIGMVEKAQPNIEGTKGARALAAAAYLETGNCFLPGRMRDDLSGPDERACPNITMSLVDEAAMFQLDGSHKSHDDQVDAWSQAMNWLRSRPTGRARTWVPHKQPLKVRR